MKTHFLHAAIAAALLLPTGCVSMQQQSAATAAPATQRLTGDMPVFTAEPELQEFEVMGHYEAVGSNITSFDRVLSRIKTKARRDGCDALVKVKFYRQAIGAGRRPATFPTIEAVGIRYLHKQNLANN